MNLMKVQQPDRKEKRKVRFSFSAKMALGLLIGIGFLFLVSRFVNISKSIQVLQHNLETPRGVLLALLSGVAFLLAFSLRGVRWRLFLHSVMGNKVSISEAIRIYQVSILLNFLLPIQGGEVSKCLMLKRIANIPVGQSLPTIAMDRSFDLLPALFIITLVPLFGIPMDIKLWLVLGIVVGLLLGLFSFVILAIWRRTAAIAFLQRITKVFPKAMASKIEGFATNFVDSLLLSTSRPRVFLLALLLTCTALICDGLFAMLAFWTTGYSIAFATAIFGYTVFNMFSILPTPPGMVGSNEAVGLLVFSVLLHLRPDKVLAMFFFSHPWAAVVMAITGTICLSSLGLKFSSLVKAAPEKSVLEEKIGETLIPEPVVEKASV